MIDNLLGLLEGWYGKEMSDLYRGQPWRGPGILMGCPVWGEKYLERFEKYCLPTIMSPKNHAALKGRCRMVLFTDMASYARLLHFTEGMETVGFDLDLRIIPQEIMAQLPPPGAKADDPRHLNKYWILGVAGNVQVQMAKRAGMAFHMLLPDHVYEQDYFPNMFRLGAKYEGIAQTGISANVDGCGPELETYKQEGGAITIPGRDLGDMGWRHLHKQTRASLMNDATIPDDLPESHLWTWQGRDKLHLYCCHMNAAYLSAAMCDKAPSRIPATIDAELPAFMPKDFYVPTAEDGMTFIEVSDETKADNPKRVNAKKFAQFCWMKVRYGKQWMPYVERVCEVPIHPQATYMEADEIEAEHARLLAMLLEIRGPDTIATEFIESLAFQ